MTTDISEFTDKELADILAESREFIEQNGWIKGEFAVWTGQEGEVEELVGVCSVGAVLLSQNIDEHNCTENPIVQAATGALTKVLRIGTHTSTECSEHGCSCTVNWVTAWNDASERDRQEVLDGFMLAEKDLRGGTVD